MLFACLFVLYLLIGMCSAQAEEVAHGLFKALRDLDDVAVDIIFVEGITEDKEGLAVMNRLRKAAAEIVQFSASS